MTDLGRTPGFHLFSPSKLVGARFPPSTTILPRRVLQLCLPYLQRQLFLSPKVGTESTVLDELFVPCPFFRLLFEQCCGILSFMLLRRRAFVGRAEQCILQTQR